jgi:Ser/Thr protein kinase RdoA (MazF antagonist)
VKALAVIGLIALLAPQHGIADCAEVVGAPVVPDGASASREDMLAANKAIKAYHVAVQTYVECLRANGGSIVRENRIVDELTKVAGKFNDELRTFKKRSGG